VLLNSIEELYPFRLKEKKTKPFVEKLKTRLLVYQSGFAEETTKSFLRDEIFTNYFYLF